MSVDPSDSIADDAVLSALRSGRRVLGRYILISEIGRGGMGVVWSARDEMLKETIALKFLPEIVAKDAIAIDELKQETRRAHRLTHPHIVRVHDFIQHAELAAICMELVEGSNLTHLRLHRPDRIFAISELTPWVIQWCEALHYAHATARIVHRDLKPGNILITPEGEVKITDFGISRSLTETQSRLTLPIKGGVNGTLAYMSPQQLLGENPQVTDDVYALGATLYDLLTGKPPFYRGDAPSLMAQIRNRAPMPLANRRAELGIAGEPIPIKWEEAIIACLAKGAQIRPKTVREILDRLGLKGESSDPQHIQIDDTRPTKSADSAPSHLADPEANTRRQIWYQRKRIRFLTTGAVILGLGFVVLWPRAKVPTRPVENPPETRAIQDPVVVAAPVPSDGDRGPILELPKVSREFNVILSTRGTGARLWLGPVSDVPILGGRAVIPNLPFGEYEMVIRAPGHKTIEQRVNVAKVIDWVEVTLSPLKGVLEITGRPGTSVDAVLSRTRSIALGTIGPSGVLTVSTLPPLEIYTLRLKHADCESMELKGVEVGSGGLTKLAALQTPLPAELTITSATPGAEVRINGSVIGRTPTVTHKVPSEQLIRVELLRAGYGRAERTLTLPANRSHACDFGALIPELGVIMVRSKDSKIAFDQMEVAIDGRPFAKVRVGDFWQIVGVPAGDRMLEIKSADYATWRGPVVVREQNNSEVEISLTPKPAIMELAVDGPSTYTLTINGQKTMVVDNRVAVPPDVYLAVELRATGFRPVFGRVSLEANSRKKLSLKMERQPLPKPGELHENSLRMKFVPVPGTTVLFSIWETRAQDFDVFLHAMKKSLRQDVANSAEPAVMMTWNEARAFCQWLTETERADGNLGSEQTYRLPTDAEWSLAVELGNERGKTSSEKSGANRELFPWGKQWPPPARGGNYAGDESEKNHRLTGFNDGYANVSPVGRFNPNRFGLYDMGGNVWEWCEDEFNAGSRFRVTRGGSFADSQRATLLSSFRGRVRENDSSDNLGFRCVLETGLSR